MTFDEILLILRDNDVRFEFVESLNDGCYVFHIYLEDEEKSSPHRRNRKNEPSWVEDK